MARIASIYNPSVAIVAGIDEAGYGPTLGPLVVSAAVFQVPDTAVDQCLWKLLSCSCTADVSMSERRLAVADSKKLFRSRSSGNRLALLERAALVMLAVGDRKPTTLRQLFGWVAPSSLNRLDEYAWYGRSDLALPLDKDVGDITTRANAVAHDCRRNGLEWVGAFCELLPEGHYNRLVRATRNKAVAMMGLVVQLVERVLLGRDDDCVRISVDRLGGRQSYREALCTALPDWAVAILEESAGRSAYRFTRGQRCCEIEFVTEGEQREFCIALASVYSKYLRECFMRLFNEYWSAREPGLRPTAGYYTDAQRWLADAQAVIDRLGIDRSRLIRER